ncbi:serine/threonine-protein kinase [Haliangium sp.]|uniref:serine/threonine-protein kinase n=1 Tax=Haliangium sp. TaxID=2663208 RepID=UPI003D0EA8BF
MARFGLIGAGVYAMIAVAGGIRVIVKGLYHEFGTVRFLLQLTGVLSFLAIWYLCRSQRRSQRFMRTVEAVGLVIGSVAIAGAGVALPAWIRPDLFTLICLSFGFVARTLYVPSSAKRTVVLGVAIGVSLAVSTYLYYQEIGVSYWNVVEPAFIGRSSSSIALGLTAITSALWAITVAICAEATRVLYGLRKQVRDVRRLGQYTLEEKLGEGGMGVVYRASHAMLRRPTAVKLLSPERAGADNLARFEREVQLTAQLTHQSTITVFDYGRTPDGVFYYAMEYIDGATLDDIVTACGAQAPARVVHILVQVAGALAEAHDVGLIHRDIKPSNIMLYTQGGVLDVAKVLDFGLVKELARAGSSLDTDVHTLAGTPAYMAPEAIRAGAVIDARSDLYALGAVGYFLLTGEHVFTATTAVEIYGHHLHSAPVPIAERLGREVPGELEAVLMACLAKDPAERPATAKELQARLRSCRDVGPWEEAAAQRWWVEHGALRRPRRAVNDTDMALARTVEIDLSRRQSDTRLDIS